MKLTTGRPGLPSVAARRTLLAILLTLLAGPAPGSDTPPAPPGAAQAAQHVIQPASLRARLLRDEPSPVRGLDPAIFSELSPVTASDPALRLPEDQRDPATSDPVTPQ